MGAKQSTVTGNTHAGQTGIHSFEGEDWTLCKTAGDLLTMESWTLLDGDLIASLSDSSEFTIIPSAEELTSWIGKLRRARHYCVYREAPDHIKNSRDAVYAGVCGDANVLEFAPQAYRHDRDIVMAAVKRECQIFSDIAMEFRADRDVALLAVRGNGKLLQHAAKSLHTDRELLHAAVKTDSSALLLCPPECWDVDLVLAAIPKKQASSAFRSFMNNESIKQVLGQRHFVMAALEKDPFILQFVSKDLKGDREIVLRAVQLQWKALQHASCELQSDNEIVAAALAQNPKALQFAAEDIKSSRAVVLEVVKKDPEALKFAAKTLQADDVISATAYATYTAHKVQAKRNL